MTQAPSIGLGSIVTELVSIAELGVGSAETIIHNAINSGSIGQLFYDIPVDSVDAAMQQQSHIMFHPDII